MIRRGEVTLGVLAGGQASRLGGVDKAFAAFKGVPLLSRTLVAVGTGYAQTLVSYNGAASRIDRMGLQAIPDLRQDFPGPLAGIEALLRAATEAWLLTIPVDLRDCPNELFELLALAHGKGAQGRGVVMVDAGGLQPLVALWPVKRSLRVVTMALDAGQTAVRDLVPVLQFGTRDISPVRLGNLNTPADFE